MSDLRQQLQAIYDQHGRLTPELVVEAARPENHPLHDRVFDRPEGEAAEAWYRHRAHDLIRCAVVYRDADAKGPRSLRAFYAIPAAGPNKYVYEPLSRVVEDGLTRRLALREMERQWKELFRKFGEMEEFLRMVGDDLADAA